MKLRYEVFHPNVTEVVDFYCDVLGFTLTTDRRQESPQYAVIKNGEAVVGCSELQGGSLAQRRPPDGSEIVLRVEDIEAAHAAVRDAGWPIADPLTEQPWGMSDFRVFDPTGQYLRVTG